MKQEIYQRNIPICLTKEEISDITKRTKFGAQSRVLAMMGINYILRPDGSPMVLRAEVESMMGVSRSKKSSSPDFSSLTNG